MTKNKEEGIEDCRAYVVRKEHRKEWKAKVDVRDEGASLCVWAAGAFIRAMPHEQCNCGCCDTLFSAGDVPQAFVVLIPIEHDQEKVKAHVIAVCSECSKHDDKRLVDQGALQTEALPRQDAAGQVTSGDM
jgi:hypothetical protein